MRYLATFCFMACVLPACATPVFTDTERAQIVTYWNAPGRYRVGAPPEACKTGPWQIRLTPQASLWFWNYQKAMGATKSPPTQDVKGTTRYPQWETWVQAKLTYDRWQAQTAADAANAAIKGGSKSIPADAANAAVKGEGKSIPTNAANAAIKGGSKSTPIEGAAPPMPGPIPPDLLTEVGNPPAFAAAVTPLQFTITYDDGETYTYQDYVTIRERYAYFRFPQGTVAYGKALRDMTDQELDPLFAAAGFTPAEQRIAKAVSKLEGGFETVNTYDTGYVSIGFIQFITYDTGRESLIEVMLRQKADCPGEYARDFHRYGLDVTPDGSIAVVDPGTGAELVGPEAVRKLVEDKRLTSVFQKAGRHSTAFRVAQIKVAKSHYWPANDIFTITVGGQTLTGKVSDIVKSEAGLATLFDRKVNRGNIAPFADVLTRVMTARNLTKLADACACEREIVAGCRYRTDFMQDGTLTQPPPPPARVPEKIPEKTPEKTPNKTQGQPSPPADRTSDKTLPSSPTVPVPTAEDDAPTTEKSPSPAEKKPTDKKPGEKSLPPADKKL